MWPIAILLVAGTLSYLGSFSGALVYDDYTAIVGNPTIRRLSSITEVLSPPGATPMSGRPVANLTLAINYAIHELDVRGYHALNLALHLLAGITLFGILARTLSRGPPEAGVGVSGRGRSLATAIALVWLVHPLLTDSVIYITQRTELLMGLFYLLTMYCSIRARESSRRRLWEAAAIVFCALGMGSKEVMVSAPLMVVLYDRVLGRETWREQLGRRWRLYAGLAATWVLLAVLVISSPRSGAGFGHGLSPWDYVRTEAGVILHYLRRAVWSFRPRPFPRICLRRYLPAPRPGTLSRSDRLLLKRRPLAR